MTHNTFIKCVGSCKAWRAGSVYRLWRVCGGL